MFFNAPFPSHIEELSDAERDRAKTEVYSQIFDGYIINCFQTGVRAKAEKVARTLILGRSRSPSPMTVEDDHASSDGERAILKPPSPSQCMFFSSLCRLEC